MIIWKAYTTADVNKTRVVADTPWGSNEMVLNCSIDQLNRGLVLRNEGAMIQNAFPFLTVSEREFLMTGITPEQWEEMFPDE